MRVLVALCAVALVAGCSSAPTTTTAGTETTTPGTAAATPDAVTTHSTQPSQPATQADKATHARASKSKPQAAKRDNSSARKTTLGTGTFTVGADIPPGRYVMTTTKGQSGNLQTTVKDKPLGGVNEILGVNNLGGTTMGVASVTADLAKDTIIKISGMSTVVFTPATTKFRTTLTTGRWVVGLDVPAGRYVATPAHKGDSGNFQVTDPKSPLGGVNEILGVKKLGGTTMGVPKVTATLALGETINVSGMRGVHLTKAG